MSPECLDELPVLRALVVESKTPKQRERRLASRTPLFTAPLLDLRPRVRRALEEVEAQVSQ